MSSILAVYFFFRTALRFAEMNQGLIYNPDPSIITVTLPLSTRNTRIEYVRCIRAAIEKRQRACIHALDQQNVLINNNHRSIRERVQIAARISIETVSQRQYH